jgi:lantibiotic modifying enzyme
MYAVNEYGPQDFPHQQQPFEGSNFSRRQFLLLGAIGAAELLAGCDSRDADTPDVPVETPPASHEANNPAAEKMLRLAGESLLARGEPSHGGLRFRSEIQAPHYQTDRDVGAASVGMGLLVLAESYPEDKRLLKAAEQTATWLLAVSETNEDGRCWPDYADDGDVSESRFTSFDDGAPGIADFLWRLGEKTGGQQYKDAAVQAMRWTFAQAENHGGALRWQWDVTDSESGYQMGMGEGMVGLVHTFATFYERTKQSDPDFAAQCKQNIDGALRFMDQSRANLGDHDGDRRALPETGVSGHDGDSAMDAGYLSGAAGAAFMYLKLHQTFGAQTYLNKAAELLDWLNDTTDGPKVDMGDKGAAWKLMLDSQGSDNTAYATGMEEGNAGIGWVHLQAYYSTHQAQYLDTAKQAADWLIAVAITNNGGLSWREHEHPAAPQIHPNLNNGAAGIGMFLLDVYKATNDAAYLQAAQGAEKWLLDTAVTDGTHAHWKDIDDTTLFAADPSWHWGTAGIAAFLARMQGGAIDIPGQQPALS